ncbi:MAG: N-formylglutamate amidohydrolase [Pseudomonadales bacterium]|jgi:predicted N-formylglutamate amidohydrolase|nr:N-formylglutamate amidohydrolase [Pseudomonadales bacterium]MCP5331776.1 N-formylglutamate amidohydrolase [Pseudomonadales bacterium]HMU89202.1 N-formylglutamate amidohydrolase [Pseudomonadales bacterium]HMW14528.1 N-formylglutamate amidohydrolase [Pseudomonadales bacterium]HMW82319.1 N-formylglutamate amidohydrolase [Pseudomonadales bacterium]
MQTAPDHSRQRLLADDEPAAYQVCCPAGASPFFLTADHASHRLPRVLGSLGLCDSDRQRHIGWDIGVAGLAKLLSAQLDAWLILQNYSRLVIDCNRPLDSPQSIVTLSEETPIPGNVALSPAEIAARQNEIFIPYHDRIRAELDLRQRQRRSTILVALHSFTPCYLGVQRPWQIGLLYHRDPRLGRRLIELLRQEPGLTVGDNQPYFISDGSDYGIPVHGEQRGIVHVEIEIRQDLLADAAGQAHWAALLARLLTQLQPEFDHPSSSKESANERQ